MKKTKKIISLVLSMLMLFSITAGINFSAYATSKTQNDALSWARSQKGKALDYDGYYGAQCVDLIYYYYNYLGVAVQGGDASAYISNSLPSGWKRVYSGFQAGDIAVWKVNHSCSTCYTDSYGHVGIITSADSSGFNAINQNYCGNMYCTENWFNISALACAIRPNWNTTTQTPNISFSEQSSNSVTNNSVGLHFVTNNPNSVTITKFGIRIRKSGTSSWTELIENQTFSMTYTKPYSNYVVGSGKELNYALTPGTTYEWQPMVVVNGSKIYDSKISTFKTTGQAPSSHTHSYTVKSTKASFSSDGSIVSSCSCGAIKSSQTIKKVSSVSLSTSNYVYDGKVKNPSVILKDSDGKVLSKDNYTVKYQTGRKLVGKYAVKITLTGNYSGTKTLYFTIKPQSTQISSVKAKSKGFYVKWNKRTTQTSGYQIRYSNNSDMSNAKAVVISKNSTVARTVSKLKGKKKYYIQVRTFKTVNGVKYYSAWSSKKTVTTKK